MKNLLFGFIAIIFISLSISANSGVNKTEGRINNESHGYSFAPPSGWYYKQADGKCAGVVLWNPSQTIYLVVKPHHSDSLASFIKNESGWSGMGIKLGGEGIMNLENNIQYVRAYQTGQNYTVYVDAFFIPLNNEGGVVIINYTESPENAKTAWSYTGQIMKSMEFAGSQSSETDGEGSPSQSNSFFAGKRLYRETGSSQYEIILCPSGKYEYNSNSFFGGLGSTTSEEYGRWQVINSGGVDYLVLDSNSGERTTYSVSAAQGNSVKLNGNSYSVSQAGCR